jgi:hypothetical protein
MCWTQRENWQRIKGQNTENRSQESEEELRASH